MSLAPTHVHVPPTEFDVSLYCLECKKDVPLGFPDAMNHGNCEVHLYICASDCSQECISFQGPPSKCGKCDRSKFKEINN